MNVSTFEGQIVIHSAKSIAFWGHYWDGFIWFPRSQVEIVPDGGSVIIHVQDWLCRKRGILEFTHYVLEDIERIAAT